MREILQIRDLRVSLAGNKVINGIDLSLWDGQQLAVVGSSGCGKTTLVKALSREIFFRGEVNFLSGKKIAVINRQHRFNNFANRSDFYYQQRFNSFDADDSRTVEEELLARGAGEKEIDEVIGLLGISHIKKTGLIQLSNGEHKRFQIAEALLGKPDWMILDCPYIGLDVKARQMLNGILDGLVEKGMHVILVTSPEEMPSSITHVGVLKDGRISDLMPAVTYRERKDSLVERNYHLPDPEKLRQLQVAFQFTDFELAVKMEDVCISYGERVILDHVNWQVSKGECWSLSGPNGSGKSTLLSLINGDNPQAFANKIWIFDRRKGSGESIWDIKRNIGYISPELHHYFESGQSCLSIVLSGLFDTMGLFRKTGPHEEAIARSWMDVLGIGQFADRMFQRLSDSEQRRVLLARALVKNPPMLILDEPCQGLDDAETNAFIDVVDIICNTLRKTLIYVTHYDAELPSCVRKRLVLNGGRVVESSPS